jgi:hypothetical protein
MAQIPQAETSAGRLQDEVLRANPTPNQNNGTHAIAVHASNEVLESTDRLTEPDDGDFGIRGGTTFSPGQALADRISRGMIVVERVPLGTGSERFTYYNILP